MGCWVPAAESLWESLWNEAHLCVIVEKLLKIMQEGRVDHKSKICNLVTMLPRGVPHRRGNPPSGTRNAEA